MNKKVSIEESLSNGIEKFRELTSIEIPNDGSRLLIFERAVDILRDYNNSVVRDVKYKPDSRDSGELDICYYNPCGKYEDEGWRSSIDNLKNEYKGLFFMINLYVEGFTYEPVTCGIGDINDVISMLDEIGNKQIHLVFPMGERNYQIYIRKHQDK